MNRGTFDPAVAQLLIGDRDRDITAMIDQLDSQSSDETVGALVARSVALLARVSHRGEAAALRALTEQFVAPRWGSTNLTDLTVSDLSAWYAEIHPPGAAKSAPVNHTGLLRINAALRVGLAVAEVEAQARGGRVVAIAPFVLPAWTGGSGPVLGPTVAGAGASAGRDIIRAKGRQGRVGSVAMEINAVGRCSLWITESRIALSPPGYPVVVGWAHDRSAVSGVKKAIRLQMLRRFRIDFIDGSSASFYTKGAAIVSVLTEALGTD